MMTVLQPNVQYCPGCNGWFDEMMLPVHGECAEPWGQGPVMAVLVGDSFDGSGPVVVVATDLDGVDWFAAIAAMIRPGGSKREIAERTVRAALGLEKQA